MLCKNCFTQIKDSDELCPYCGYAEGDKAALSAHMSPGVVLNERYSVGRVLGYGGFGVTYLGFDSVLKTTVAIKEYLPSNLASRTMGQTMITVFSGEKEELFNKGCEKFMDEARRLAKFSGEEGIVHIFDTFKENNTAYLVMEYLDGETLKDHLGKSGPMSTEEALKIITPLCNSLSAVHAQGIIHRDIAPDNIMILKSGEVRLIDFGAARYATSPDNQSLTVIVKPGYSAKEQYIMHSAQSASEDVYSLAGVFYTCVTGEVPADAMERYALLEQGKKDPLKKPSQIVKGIPSNIDTAVLNALNINQENRTKSAKQFLEELTGAAKRNEEKIEKIKKKGWPLWAKIVLPTTLVAVVALLILFLTGVIGFKKNENDVLAEGQTKVPQVISETKDDAKKDIDNAKLIMQIIDKNYSDEIAADLVLKQSLKGGSTTKIGDTLGLIISGGVEEIKVPNIEGLTEEEAVKKLTAAGFKVERIESVSAAKEGTVASDNKSARKLPKGSTITVTVSTGLKDVDTTQKTEVPDITGKTYKEALEVLAAAKLTVVVEKRTYKENPVNEIISQDIATGETVAEGTEIKVVISEGPDVCEVPDVEYKSEAEAVEILEEAGFTVTVRYTDSETVVKDHVVTQSVTVGTEIERGSDIEIRLSNGNENAKSEEKIKKDFDKTENRETEAEETLEDTTNEKEYDINDLRVGDIILFGWFQHAIYNENVAEYEDMARMIEWVVLGFEDDCVLVTTKYLIDYAPEEDDYTEWPSSADREHLNEIYWTAFDDLYRNAIVEVDHFYFANSEYEGERYQIIDSTNDYLFYLSLNEAATINVDIVCTLITGEVGCWKLRDTAPGGNLYRVSSYEGICETDSAAYVRPAMYLRMDDLAELDVTVIPGDDASGGNSSGDYPVDDENFYNEEKTFETVSLGNYEGHALTWKVLNVENGQALLLCEYPLDERYQYNEDFITGTTWENCTLRSFLNDEFLNVAFTEADKTHIRPVNVINEPNYYYGTDAGNNTVDRVFLLSLDEMKKYCIRVWESDKDYQYLYNDLIAKRRDGTQATWSLRSFGSPIDTSVSQYENVIWVYDDLIDAAGVEIHCLLDIRPAIYIDESLLLDLSVAPEGGGEGDVETDPEPEKDYKTITMGKLNGRDLKWRVLDDKDGYALVICEYLLDEPRAFTDNGNSDWEHSSIREWLYSEFYDVVFSDAEKKVISNVRLSNSNGGSFEESIMLLSAMEAQFCFKDDNDRRASTHDGNTGSWWLRDVGVTEGWQSIVLEDGELNLDGYDVNCYYYVRPCMLVDVARYQELLEGK